MSLNEPQLYLFKCACLKTWSLYLNNRCGKTIENVLLNGLSVHLLQRMT